MATAFDVWTHRNAQANTFVSSQESNAEGTLLPVQLARSKQSASVTQFVKDDKGLQRGLLTPLAEDVSPSRAVAIRPTGPFPESVLRAAASLKSTPVGSANAAQILTEMSLLDYYVPAVAISELLFPHMGTNEEANESNRPIPTNPHGEPICYVACSAAQQNRQGFEFSPLQDKAPPVRGLPPPHSTSRHSNRGLVQDSLRHEVPVSDLCRTGRAERFLLQMSNMAHTNSGPKVIANSAAMNNQWTAVDRNAKGEGFEAVTVAATHRGDRHGLARYYHRYEDDKNLPLTTPGGPSHVGSTFAVASELQRNRLAAMQSRVLIPTERSPAQRDLPKMDQSSGSAVNATRAEIEAAAVMADPVEVPDESFKITALPAPSKRQEDSLSHHEGREIKSQKELAKRLNLGGRIW